MPFWISISYFLVIKSHLRMDVNNIEKSRKGKKKEKEFARVQ